MNFQEKDRMIVDKGGTRSGIERRQYIYTDYTPERRTGDDRRKKADRRSGVGRRRGNERRGNPYTGGLIPVERRDMFR